MNLRDGMSLALACIGAAVTAGAGAQARDAEAVLADSSAWLAQLDAPLHMPLGAALSPGMAFGTSEAGSSRIVKGAPYQADAVSESTQVLMDGNRIVRRSVQRLARDGEGRTRIERLRADGSVESVIINDVAAGKRYWLVPDKKRAVELAAGPSMHRSPVPPAPPAPPAPAAPGAAPVPPAPPPAMSADEARSWADEMRRWARDVTGRLRVERTSDDGIERQVVRNADGTAHVVIRQSDSAGDGEHRRAMDVDVVRVIESSGDPADSTVLALGALPPLPIEGGPRGQGVTTALGSRDFDRVRADGSRTTWTIPAGRIGNEKPIEVVSERWYAPELLLVVSSRNLDPRRGETSYRLNNLKRGEPDAVLFQVPADYERKPRKRHQERGGS